MTTIQYPERDLEQDKDLEIFFLMRKQKATELQARNILGFHELNHSIEEAMEEMGGSGIDYLYFDGYQ